MSFVEVIKEGPPIVECELNDEGDRIKVTFDYDRDDVKRIKSVPGARWYPPNKGGPHWLLPRDLTSARILREAFGDRLVLGPRVKAWGKEAREKEAKLAGLSDAKDADLPNLRNHHPKFYKWLRDYQRAGAAMMAATSCINADEPGTGKTAQTIASILERSPHGRHLIVAPKTSLNSVWADHFERLSDLPYITMSGDDTAEERFEVIQFMKDCFANDEPLALILNPAFIRFVEDKDAEPEYVKGKKVKPMKPAWPELFEVQWSTVVFDEYHKMGLANNATNTFRAANSLSAEHKLLLSGTPMGGKPIKMWGALHFLDPASFTSKWRWADQFLVVSDVDGGRSGMHKVIEGVRDEREQAFWDHLKPYMVRRTKREILPELPAKLRIDRWCEMTPTQKKQYEKFAADAELKIEEENLSATGVLAEYMRLKQFSNAKQKVAHMGNGDLKVLPTFDSGKLPVILELLEERGINPTKGGEKDDSEGDEQVVIFSQFSTVVDMIHEWLTTVHGIKAEKITGATKGEHRTDLVTRFQSGEVRVLVISTTAGGVALTLDKASTAIIVDETWDPDDQVQAEDRVHRISRIHQVTIYYLRSKGTIEEYIQKVVGGKAITNKNILDLRRMGLKAI